MTAASSQFPRRAFAVVAGYLVAQILVRLWVATSAELDQAEQLVLTQELQWGYASQPPLYTWVQALAFQVFGVNLFALLAVKTVLLFSLAGSVYGTTRQITQRHDLALLSLAMLAFIPQFTWESQRDLTHSVIATAAAAGSLWTFVQLARSRRAGWYAMFGISAGLAVLGKYNTCIFLASLLGATMLHSELRARLWSRWLWLSLAGFALVAGPHLIWMATHHGAVLTQSEKLFAVDARPLYAAWAAGLGRLLNAIAGFLGPLVAIYFVARWRAAPVSADAATRDFGEMERLLKYSLLLALALGVVAALGFHADFKDRWLQPVGFAVPIWLAIRAGRWLDPGRLRVLVGLAVMAALGAMMAIVLQPRVFAWLGQPARMAAPFRQLAAQLPVAAGERVVMLANSRWVGGNVKLRRPAATVLVPELPTVRADRSLRWLAVWDATKRTNPPPALVELVRAQRGLNLADQPAHFVKAPYRYLPGKTMKLGWVELPRGP